MVTFEYPIDIIKLANSGQVAVYNSSTNIFVTSYSPDNVKITTTDDETVKITFDNNDAVYFNINLVDNTQIQPAIPIAFAGTVFDLAELLATDFFFEVGGITLPIDAVDVTYDNAVSGLAATDVQAAIDELAAGGGGAQLYAKGTYNTFANIGARTGYIAFDPTILIYQDFAVITPVVLDAIRFKTNSNPAGQMSFTLYKADDNGNPDLKIVEVTFNTATPIGAQIVTFADQTLDAGVYFWAIQSNVNVSFWVALTSKFEFGFNGRDDDNLWIIQKYITPHVYATPTPTPATAPTNTLYLSGATNAFFVQSRVKA